MFLLRLMYSGRDLAWLYPRQDQVCFLDGHVRAFAHLRDHDSYSDFLDSILAANTSLPPHVPVYQHHRQRITANLFGDPETQRAVHLVVEAEGKLQRLGRLVCLPAVFRSRMPARYFWPDSIKAPVSGAPNMIIPPNPRWLMGWVCMSAYSSRFWALATVDDPMIVEAAKSLIVPRIF